jgi:hypothetical protein
MSSETGSLTFNGSIENLYSLYLKLDMLKTITDDLSETDAEKVNYVYDLLDTSFPFLRMIKMAQSNQNDEDDDDEKEEEQPSEVSDEVQDEVPDEVQDETPDQSKEEMQAYYLAKLQAIMDKQEQEESEEKEKKEKLEKLKLVTTEKKVLKENKIVKEPKVTKEPKTSTVKMCQFENCASPVAPRKYKFCEQHTKTKK